MSPDPKSKTTIYLGRIYIPQGEDEYIDIPQGALAVNMAGQIEIVDEKQKVLKQYPEADIKDYSDCLIMPGFVDCHQHLTHYEWVRLIPDLMEWLKHIYKIEAKFIDPEYSTKIANFFFNDLLENGTTTVCAHGPYFEEATDAAFEVAVKKNIQVVMGMNMGDMNLPSPMKQSPKESLKAAERLFKKWDGANNGLINYCFTVRPAYCASVELLRGVAEMANHYNARIQCHLAEDEEGVKEILKYYPDCKSDTEVYYKTGILGPRTIMAHGIYLLDSDYELLAETGTTIAHCPRANLLAGGRQMDCEKMRKAGINIGLGTDLGGGKGHFMNQVIEDSMKINKKMSIHYWLYVSFGFNINKLFNTTMYNLLPNEFCKNNIFTIDNIFPSNTNINDILSRIIFYKIQNMGRIQNDENKFEEKYEKLAKMLFQSFSSKDNNELINIIKGENYKNYISNLLGNEVSNLYFYNQDQDRLLFFSEACNNPNFDFPIFHINDSTSEGLYLAQKVSDSEFIARRKEQRNMLKEKNEFLTVEIGHKILNTPIDKRLCSEFEKNNHIIFIPQGEIITFSFEYFILQTLNDLYGKSNFSFEEIIISAWENMHINYQYMKNRQNDSLESMCLWLQEILYNPTQYKYLWENTHWFTKYYNELIIILNNFQKKHDIINKIGELIINFELEISKDYILQREHFYRRSRISPHMELYHGTHNILMFFINLPYPQIQINITYPIQAFYLGTYFNKKICLDHSSKIKNIFSAIAMRNIIAYSFNSINQKNQEIIKTEKFMDQLSDYVFVHGLKSPFTSIRNSVTIIKRSHLNSINEKETIAKIENKLNDILSEIKKGLFLIDRAKEITKAAHSSNKKELDIIGFIKEYLKNKVFLSNIVLIDNLQNEKIFIMITDEFSITQILDNFINNSIEAIEEKGIGNKIMFNSKIINNNIQIEIVDNGPGVETKFIENFINNHYSPFKSTKEGVQRGLGLYICNNLIQLQNGKLIYNNNCKIGTSFYLLFPIQKGELK
ncbi:MAG TPA: amidohydrolase family protein [bacterium]|nr:amidohydrolase family protein [bacterium]HPN43945.1 amidohydrolase family protein [bacterium]